MIIFILRAIAQKTVATYLLIVIIQLYVTLHVNADPNNDAHNKFWAELRAKDKCGTILISKAHGYDVQTHKVVTADKYELNLHRIIHPSDFATNGPLPGTKKPYLLLHGLVGSSASFVRNIPYTYKAPGTVFNLVEPIDQILNHKQSDYEYIWSSTADRFSAAYDGDVSATYKGTKGCAPKKEFSKLNELDFDGDSLSFGREFKQAHRKFYMPTTSKGHITNSLALTLSNFGYDVWLINLRGNQYSRTYNGRLSAEVAEYWDFNIDTLIKEDLPAAINYVKKKTDYLREPLGLVSYSYSSAHVLGLLTKFPIYQDTLQPIIMMAPTLLSATADRTKSFKYFMKLVTGALVSHNGPFPAFGRKKRDKLERLICQLPVASKLCRLLETILYGRKVSVGSLIFENDKQTAMIKKDVDCGQTSTASLHQIIENLNNENLHFKYRPFIEARNKVARGARLRRSVMLIHSEADDIAPINEVTKIRESALRLMALVDLVIKEPKFGHTDFLFSLANQYLVNGEIVRMAALYDFMLKRPTANMPLVQSRGY